MLTLTKEKVKVNMKPKQIVKLILDNEDTTYDLVLTNIRVSPQKATLNNTRTTGEFVQSDMQDTSHGVTVQFTTELDIAFYRNTTRLNEPLYCTDRQTTYSVDSEDNENYIGNLTSEQVSKIEDEKVNRIEFDESEYENAKTL